MADDFAVEAFKKAIEVNPQWVDAYFWLAECLGFHFAEWEQAEAIILQGLQIAPDRNDLIELLGTARDSIAEWKRIVQNLKKR